MCWVESNDKDPIFFSIYSRHEFKRFPAVRVSLILSNLENIPGINIGLGIMAAMLKNNGHAVQGIQLNEDMGMPFDLEKIKNKIKEFNPDLIAFSSISNQYKFVSETASYLKKYMNVPILCGGTHPTICPGEVISDEFIDYICIGEGEYALLELVEKMKSGKNTTNIKNIWCKEHEKIIRNEIRPLIQDLDTLPFPDRDKFDFERILEKKIGWVEVMTGRGCPFSCTYCINSYYNKIFRGQNVTRRRSVENVLAEIEELKNKYNDKIKMINFQDDNFSFDKKWVMEFCEKYLARFEIPFACNIRVNNFDREIAFALKGAGCEEVKIGIESGSDRVRKSINRFTPDEMIIDSFKWAKEAGLRSWSFNMVGIPTETKEDLLMTAKLNAKFRPYVLRCSILYPFEGTEIFEFCSKNKMIDNERKKTVTNYFDRSILNLPFLSDTDILKFKTMFKWYIDAYSNIEAAPFFKELITIFNKIPDEKWLDGSAKKRYEEIDRKVDMLLRELKKEHYATREGGHLDLNFCKELNFELP